VTSSVRASLARRLEAGAPGSRLAGLAAAAWGALARVERPLRIPAGVRLIGVGGAVLGGAGKTPVAISLARVLGSRAEPAALIGHAYHARPGRPRVVLPGDPVSLVGDDALAAARLLEGTSVIVASRRQDAVDHAAALGHRVLVADGLLQTTPRRLDAAVLVLDALAPWGAGACPPAGDLRAPRAALLSAADHVVALLPEGAAPSEALPPSALLLPSRIAGVVTPAGLAPLASLAGRRLGLILAIARPRRIEDALARAGLSPAVTILLADHAVPRGRTLARAERAPVDGWLTTVRCATKLPPLVGRAPVLPLVHEVDVGPLLARLDPLRAC
jgi:tetraacyldisaccharide 4'-kinase